MADLPVEFEDITDRVRDYGIGAGATSPWVRVSDWHGKEPPSRIWRVPELIPARTVTLLSGHGGIGKGTLGVQLLAAAATGGMWLGRQVMKCPAIGLFAEDDQDELQRRFARVCRTNGLELGQLEGLAVRSLADRDALLAAPADRTGLIVPTGLFEDLRKHALATGARLLFLDPAADLFGGDEIDRVQVRAFLALLRRLAIEIDGAVVLTAHPSREGMRDGSGYSGSTAWHNGVRSLLYLASPKDDGGAPADPYERVLHHLKCNLGPRVDDIPLRWADGAFVADLPGGGMVATIEKGVVERDFLEGLDKLSAQGRYASASPNSPAFAPKMMRRDLGLKHSTKVLRTAMNSLFEKGEIAVDTIRRGNRHEVPGIVKKGAE